MWYVPILLFFLYLGNGEHKISFITVISGNLICSKYTIYVLTFRRELFSQRTRWFSSKSIVKSNCRSSYTRTLCKMQPNTLQYLLHVIPLWWIHYCTCNIFIGMLRNTRKYFCISHEYDFLHCTNRFKRFVGIGLCLGKNFKTVSFLFTS